MRGGPLQWAMARFLMRTPRTPTRTVELPRDAARLVPEALRHVASSVFEDEDDERHHLRDAAAAVLEAVQDGSGATVSFEVSEDEGRHVPEALGHVAHEIFRDSPQESLLRQASRAFAEVFPAPSGPRR